jgi:hypothetical protein
MTKTAFASSDSVVNGIDTEAVHALIQSVEAEPAKGMTHWYDPLAGRQHLAGRHALSGSG